MLSFLVQRYEKFLKHANILATIFNDLSLFFALKNAPTLTPHSDAPHQLFRPDACREERKCIPLQT